METIGKNMRTRSILWTTLVLAGLLITGSMIWSQVMDRTPTSSYLGDGSLYTPMARALAGHELVVPDKTGFVVHHTAAGPIFQQASEQAGSAVSLDLCEQRTLARTDPQRLYPIVIGPSWSEIRSGQIKTLTGISAGLRFPIVVPADIAQSMPIVVVEGAASGLSDNNLMAVRLVDRSEEHVHTAVFGDAIAPETNIWKDSSAARIQLGKLLWVLWNPDSSGVFQTALRLERIAGGNRCLDGDRQIAPGLLRITLHRAATTVPARFKLVLRSTTARPNGGYFIDGRLASGRHAFPKQANWMEDEALYGALRQQQLLRRSPQGQLEVAPADLSIAQALGLRNMGWPDPAMTPMDRRTVPITISPHNVPLTGGNRALIGRLHRKADGLFIRREVHRYNDAHQLAAMRTYASDPAIRQTLEHVNASNAWHITVDGIPASFVPGLPDRSVRLLKEPPQQWSSWLRVRNWPTLQRTEHPKIELALDLDAVPGLRGQALSILSLGKLHALEGAHVLGAWPACDGTACPTPKAIMRTDLLIEDEAAHALRLELEPAPAELAEWMAINGTSSQLLDDPSSTIPRWRPSIHRLAGAGSTRNFPIETQISTRDGVILLEHGKNTDASSRLGLLPVVGIDANHRESIDWALHASGHQRARLTIDGDWQQIAHAVLECIAIRGWRWDAGEEDCIEQDAPETDEEFQPSGRRASLVLLDGSNGAIRAAVSFPEPQGLDPAEALAYLRHAPANSPLLFSPWQHERLNQDMPGSTFKLVAAIGFELASQNNRQIDGWLDGMTSRDGLNFNSPCYPDCVKPPFIRNFRSHHLQRYVNANGRVGLTEAIGNSINTYFAFLGQNVDSTLSASNRYALPQSLAGGLEAHRPVENAAVLVGFGRSFRLDAGMITGTINLPEGSILASTASDLMTLRDTHQVRQQAIGLRAWATPLQMAQVSAAIATGKSSSPFILEQVDEREAHPISGQKLAMRLDRIREGMHFVVQQGTAATAFSRTEARRSLRSNVYGKTGTAPYRDKGSVNSAWFTGYWEQENYPLAFAVKVTETRETGGAVAAEVAAALLETRYCRKTAACPRSSHGNTGTEGNPIAN